ncbi:hypothetical protein CVV43_02580 [Candidatus Saccharibacteria bacterium HGW-Saccharibacteria-1]|nr:MAG: hypothetical protein CVV43_02580 [Candidatus Saccharibacteria bacterium HGW-Saccharibacteria-1]
MSDRIDNLDDYIDLTNPEIDLGAYKIFVKSFDCQLIGPSGEVYKGFILAKSPSGLAYTVIDTSFQYSNKDKRFPVRLTFRRTNSKLEDKPINKGNRFQRIAMEDGGDGYREFWKVIAFLMQFEEVVGTAKMLDVFQLVSKDAVIRSLKDKKISDQKQELLDYIEESDVTIEDIVNALVNKTRISDLEEFRKLLTDENDYINKYRINHSSEIPRPGNEAVWNHFLMNHKWIFGLGLDLRFMNDFVGEAAVGNPATDGKGNPHVDMLGWTDYTTLVEIKTPDAKYFTSTKSTTARANTWSFTPGFIDGISQVLAQKDDWLATHNFTPIIHETNGVKEILNNTLVRTVDPKAIFIYGNKSVELPPSSTILDTLTKRDTLERYSRNNRNVTIISFDELYTRAYHIVHGKLPPLNETAAQPDPFDGW